MATTIPTKFEGTPTLTLDKVAIIKDWYVTALGDQDKADSPEDEAFYAGNQEGLESVLQLLYGPEVTYLASTQEMADAHAELKRLEKEADHG